MKNFVFVALLTFVNTTAVLGSSRNFDLIETVNNGNCDITLRCCCVCTELSDSPTNSPTENAKSSMAPTIVPSAAPFVATGRTYAPTASYSASFVPTAEYSSTFEPTAAPSASSEVPTASYSASFIPTATNSPSSAPSAAPFVATGRTYAPTASYSASFTPLRAPFVSNRHSARPSQNPSPSPTGAPTQLPTQPPSSPPTQEPTQPPSQQPSQVPTEMPTQEPTLSPSQDPTMVPSALPSDEPSLIPSDLSDTAIPTFLPTADTTCIAIFDFRNPIGELGVSQTYTTSNLQFLQITAFGYKKPSIPTCLYSKGKRSFGPEAGLGIAYLPPDFEINEDSFVQLDLAALYSIVPLPIQPILQVGSLQPGEMFEIYGSSEQGVLGVLLRDGEQVQDTATNSFDMDGYGYPPNNVTTFRYVSVTAGIGNVLINGISIDCSKNLPSKAPQMLRRVQ